MLERVIQSKAPIIFEREYGANYLPFILISRLAIVYSSTLSRSLRLLRNSWWSAAGVEFWGNLELFSLVLFIYISKCCVGNESPCQFL